MARHSGDSGRHEDTDSTRTGRRFSEDPVNIVPMAGRYGRAPEAVPSSTVSYSPRTGDSNDKKHRDN